MIRETPPFRRSCAIVRIPVLQKELFLVFSQIDVNLLTRRVVIGYDDHRTVS